MNELKSNNSVMNREQTEGGNTSNVSTFVKREEKTYVRRYAMSEGQRRVWLENHKPGEEDSIMFPSMRSLKAEEAASDDDRREKAKILMICLGIALVLLLLYPIAKLAASHLVIEEIRIEGSTMYTAEQLLSAGGLKVGDGMPILTADTAEETLLSNLPYIQSCNISFELPNTLIFNLTDEVAAVYTEIYGEYYALSSSLRVLERAESSDSFSHLLYIEIPRVTHAVVGEQLEFDSGETGDYIAEFLSLLSESDLQGRVGRVYFDQKFDIVASVDGKYRVMLGSPADMKLKLATVSKMIEENAEECTGNGLIDVRVVELAGIVINTDLDPDARE